VSDVRGLLSVGGDQILFWCPGCDHPHAVSTKLWAFNGDYEKPTFSPSVLVHPSKRFIDEDLDMPELVAPGNITMSPRCHSFVNQGRIEFLGDSTHELAGQTVDIPAWPYQ
jgi:hypothetical protein